MAVTVDSEEAPPPCPLPTRWRGGDWTPPLHRKDTERPSVARRGSVVRGEGTGGGAYPGIVVQPRPARIVSNASWKRQPSRNVRYGSWGRARMSLTKSRASAVHLR